MSTSPSYVRESRRPRWTHRWWIQHRIERAIVRAALAVVVWINRDSNYLKHLHAEVPTWFAEPANDPNRWMAEGTRDLLAVLASQGHSGSSFNFAIQFFEAMARFKPWGPLTGADSEWIEVGPGVRQNRRCGHIFAELTPVGWLAYNSEGRVFQEPSGATYLGRDSRTPVTFPYDLPPPTIIKVRGHGEPNA